MLLVHALSLLPLKKIEQTSLNMILKMSKATVIYIRGKAVIIFGLMIAAWRYPWLIP